MEFIRNFTVAGRLAGNCTDGVGTEVYLPDMDVELWHKAPLNIIYLGKGTTDSEGNFKVEVAGNYPFIKEGKISDVFLRVYNNGVLINPDEQCDCAEGSYNNDFNNDFEI